jgi:glucosamine--fructose-6-phosphate aminotransferase (isomerizing)
MCGIVGYIGEADKKEVLMDGLQELEYRGYDSAGIAILEGSNITHFKAVGKLQNLRDKTANYASTGAGVGIGHTRWATHGKPNEVNAHPHLGEYSFVVHNGIIENYQSLKKELKSEGKVFLSQTDTEVIIHLFEHFYNEENNAFEAFQKTIARLEGAYAVLLITKIDETKIFFAKNGSPMMLGTNKSDEIFFGSSDAALIGKATDVIYLEDGDYGFAQKGEISLYQGEEKQEVSLKPLKTDKIYAQKEGYRFFMEKEIYEQSKVLGDTMIGRVLDDEVQFACLPDDLMDGIREIKICACGTSYHTALSASYLFERLSKIQTSIEIASEFRYKEPLLTNDTLFVVISQSGETADTLEALKMAKRKGLKTMAICNVDNSSIVREADTSLLTRAGVEKGVASTKAFATQMMVLWMFAVSIAKDKITKEEYTKELEAMRQIPRVVQVREEIHEKVKRLSKRYLHGHGFFFIGRDIFYPLALEGALKLKEISYLHAGGYPSGEMKHGPIALADSELFTIALMPKTLLYEKTKSNVEELAARDSTICAISPEPFDLADDFIKTKYDSHPMCEFFEMMVVVQLLSLEVAVRLGNDVDMPRNLAKSVTVE